MKRKSEQDPRRVLKPTSSEPRRVLRPARPVTCWLLAVVLLVVAGCGGSVETAVITDRPTPPPAAEAEQPAQEEEDPRLAEAAALDTVEAGRFDQGRMWTFEEPPLAYFEEAYGFRPDSAWLAEARLGALRFADYCSASFVSPNGLVLTNHHCGRESITSVARSGEDLLESGFYAESIDEERPVEELYVEQLVAIEDVTEEVYAAAEEAGDDEAQARARRAQALEEEMTRAAQERDTTLRVQVVELYSGGRYSAYTYRRYDDVRLVMAPELQIGFYGQDDDNFTYPRYNLDASLFRVYNEAGEPLQSTHYFPWDTTGAQEGDAVFVVGNPGTTDRLSTVSQLEYQRDYALPQELAVLRERAQIVRRYIEARPQAAETYDLQNVLFSLENSIKATAGALEGLRDPYLIARRRAAQEELQQAIAESDSLQQRYGNVISRIRQLQRSKEILARQSRAFTYFGSPQLGSRILTRALYGYFYGQLRRRPGASGEQLQNIREEALSLEDWPAELEEAFITARLRALEASLGTNDPTVQGVLQGRAPEAVAQALVQNSALIDSSGFARLLERGYLGSDDPSVEVIRPIASLFLEVNRQVQDFQTAEENLEAQLARARFALGGTDAAPDATFTLRIADGIVDGYAYNGTRAPAHTTYLGLYDHYYAYSVLTGLEAWDLPARWLDPPTTFDRTTPLNLVSTNDITGGNSGSPLLNRELELVGLVFDSNIQALPNTYLYRTESGARAVSVDVRGMLEALDDIYDADRLVEELTTGTLVASEAAADTQAETSPE